jgi:cyclophilin family peptidyl-prolyl cis-trans isomerase
VKRASLLSVLSDLSLTFAEQQTWWPVIAQSLNDPNLIGRYFAANLLTGWYGIDATEPAADLPAGDALAKMRADWADKLAIAAVGIRDPLHHESIRELAAATFALDPTRTRILVGALAGSPQAEQPRFRSLIRAIATAQGLDLAVVAPSIPTTEEYAVAAGFRRASGPTRAWISTTKGSMEIALFPDDAPLHVASFIALARDGVFNGLPFHRVVPNFVIQGGDPHGSGWGGPGYRLPDEIGWRHYVRGTIGMPKSDKDTGGCQIFVNHSQTPHLDFRYTIWGQVVRGFSVIDDIDLGDRILRVEIIE